jgi:hypothetical protein
VATQVKFYYRNTHKTHLIETVITSIVDAVSTLIELPNSLEICLYDLPNEVYGGVDKNIYYRIGINSTLQANEIPTILVHELIHVNQRHTKLLEIKQGVYYWRGIPYYNKPPDQIDYDEYKNCPWEIDVDNRVNKLLTEALELANKKHLAKLDNKSG